jgi:hypothetical protein
MKPTNVDQYVASLPSAHAEIVEALRAVIKKAAPKANETYKWAQPVYEQDGPMIWVKAFSRYVNIGFWRGAEMQDKHDLLVGEGSRMRHVTLHSVQDIKKGALTDYIKQAVALNRAGGDPTRRMGGKK